MSNKANISLRKLGTAPTRLRQIALVTKDLEGTKSLLTYVLGVESIFEDPAVAQWGLKNILLPVGGDIIEVVSPFKEGTTAGRLLAKRGDGGYMVIMQTEDAKKRRESIEAQGLAKVIFSYDHEDAVCIQYHPKGIKGGVIPELDSHTISSYNPKPLTTRLSPWHACGPDYENYSRGMKRSEHLTLEGCVLQLQPGDLDHEAASRQWEETFGVGRSRDLLAFTNARLGFVPGREDESEGLVSITIGVNGRAKHDAIIQRATHRGVWKTGWLEMCGIRWYIVLTGHGEIQGKL